MTIKIEITTDNAAFDDHNDGEVGRILAQLADRLKRQDIDIPTKKKDARPLFDANGQRVGFIWGSRQ